MQTTLLKALDDALATSAPSSNDPTEQQEAHHRRIDNLLNAITAAGVHVADQDYWRSLQAKAKGEEPELKADQSFALDGANKSDLEPRDDIAAHIDEEGGVNHEIRGISKDAEISVEPGIRRPDTETEDMAQGLMEEVVDKGKGKEKA